MLLDLELGKCAPPCPARNVLDGLLGFDLAGKTVGVVGMPGSMIGTAALQA